MTEITTADVQRLARLSSVRLTDDEATTLSHDIKNILDHVTQLSELDTDGVEPTYQVTDLKNVWRDDSVDIYSIDREALLALAPDVESHHIKVPKVL